jgi:hypothetical protein
MPTRVRHALRFAVTTLAAVYLVGTAWTLADAYLLGAAADAGATVRFNESVWRRIAAALAVAVFLLRLSDVHTAPPPWSFAWMTALWLAAASVAVTVAIGSGRFALAALVAALAVAVWLVLHRRIPGWPGHVAPAAAPDEAVAERDLQRLR